MLHLLIMCLFVVVMSPTVARAQELTLRIERSGEGLQILVDDRAKAAPIFVDAAGAAALMAICFSIECMNKPQECAQEKVGPFESERAALTGAQLQQVLREQCRIILGPVATRIRHAARLRITLPRDLLKLSLDALDLDGRPLFAHKPIVYAWFASLQGKGPLHFGSVPRVDRLPTLVASNGEPTCRSLISAL